MCLFERLRYRVSKTQQEDREEMSEMSRCWAKGSQILGSPRHRPTTMTENGLVGRRGSSRGIWTWVSFLKFQDRSELQTQKISDANPSRMPVLSKDGVEVSRLCQYRCLCGRRQWRLVATSLLGHGVNIRSLKKLAPKISHFDAYGRSSSVYTKTSEWPRFHVRHIRFGQMKSRMV